MWDERSFDTRSFDERSWLFLIQTPYVELSRHERAYIRSVLATAYSTEHIEQIVSVATLHKLSVLDTVQLLVAKRVEPTASTRNQAAELRNLAAPTPARVATPVDGVEGHIVSLVPACFVFSDARDSYAKRTAAGVVHYVQTPQTFTASANSQEYTP